MHLRKVSIQDYNKIKFLFKRNNLEIISFKKWIKLWKKNPIIRNKKNYIRGWVIENKKKIIGHLGSFPTEYLLYNKFYICDVIHNWAVDQKYRYQSALLLKKLFAQSNADFFLSSTTNYDAGKLMKAMNMKQVPSESLNYSYFIILNLKKFIKFVIKKKKISLPKLFFNIFYFLIKFLLNKKVNYWTKKSYDSHIVRYNKIDFKFDHFWKKIKNLYKNKLLIQRNQNWLKWHLNDLLKNDKTWIFLKMKSKKIIGYAICVEENNYKNDLKKAFLIDLISLDKKKDLSINLIAACMQEAKKRNCDVFEFRGFGKREKLCFDFFKPFRKKIEHNPFYYISNDQKLKKLLNKESYWFPTYLDGDTIKNF